MLRSLLGSSLDGDSRQVLSMSSSNVSDAVNPRGALPLGALGIVLSGNEVDQIVAGSPADQCGKILSGDIVESVDGVAVTASSAASYLRQSTGSSVLLRLTRKGSGASYEAQLFRSGRPVSPMRTISVISAAPLPSTRSASPLRREIISSNSNTDSSLPELQLLRAQLQDLLRTNEDLRSDNASLRSKAAWADELARRYDLLRKDVSERSSSQSGSEAQNEQLREATKVAKEALLHADMLKSENHKLRQKVEELAYLKDEVGRENLGYRTQLLQLQQQLQTTNRPSSPAALNPPFIVRATASNGPATTTTVSSNSSYGKSSISGSNNNNGNISPARAHSPSRGPVSSTSSLFTPSSSMPTQQWNRPVEWLRGGASTSGYQGQGAATRQTAAATSANSPPSSSYYNVGYPGPSTWAYTAAPVVGGTIRI